ncbi:MAG: hypothetical protein RJQ09_02295 [Cyclobacteriaceae bacterium]
MSAVTIDFILSGLVYLVLIYFMITLLAKRKRSTDSDDDNDGGITVSGPPKIDLPPGICLPDDPVRKLREEQEEVLV